MNLITLVNIDVDKKSSSEYRKYQKLKDAQYIPYTIIVDPRGQVVWKKVGAMSADELARETRKHVK